MKAPVTYNPHLLLDHQRSRYFDLLWEELPWEHRENAPRRECWLNPYGESYTYGSGEHARTYEAHPLLGWNDNEAISLVWGIMQHLNLDYGSSYDCCFVNGYAHGRQHLGWHSDDSPEMDMDHPIATVSLGAEREIWFRPKPIPVVPASQDFIASPALTLEENKLSLANGSVAIMHAGMQRDWQHRIPKSPLGEQCPPRISLTFRRLVR